MPRGRSRGRSGRQSVGGRRGATRYVCMRPKGGKGCAGQAEVLSTMYLLDAQHGRDMDKRQIDKGSDPSIFPGGFHLSARGARCKQFLYTQGCPNKITGGRWYVCVCLGKGSQMPGVSKNNVSGLCTQADRSSGGRTCMTTGNMGSRPRRCGLPGRAGGDLPSTHSSASEYEAARKKKKQVVRQCRATRSHLGS